MDNQQKLKTKTKHRWNINKQYAHHIIIHIINMIFDERIHKTIHLSDLSILINKRYNTHYNIIIRKNNKPKTLYNFIKVEFSGIEHFINEYCESFIIDNEYLVKHTNEWYIVTENDY